MNNEYLAFVDEIGRSVSGEYIYRLDFTYDPESVWGDYFNSVPSIIVPDLQPDTNSLSSTAKIRVKKQLSIAKKNGCFSMQDCIDGIISLCFSEIDEEPIMSGKELFRLDFGETFESVEKKLNENGIEIEDKNDIDVGEEEINVMLDKIKPALKENFVIMKFSVGTEYDREKIKTAFFEKNYKLVDLVENEGEYAIRGYMIDVFSYGEEYPFRINFFGNVVEEIFSFDFYEGKEVKQYNEITIYMKGL